MGGAVTKDLCCESDRYPLDFLPFYTLKMRFFVVLKGGDAGFREGVEDVENKSHAAEEGRGDEGSEDKHDLQLRLAEREGAGRDGGEIAHAEQGRVDGDGGNDLAELTEEHKKGVGRSVVAGAGGDFDLVDGVGDHCPNLQNEEVHAHAAEQAEEHKEIKRSVATVHKEQEGHSKVGYAGDHHTQRADLFFTVLADKFGREEH